MNFLYKSISRGRSLFAIAPSSGKGIMSFLLKPAHWLLVALALSATAAGQLVPTQLTTSTSGAANAAHDPLGRDTPSGTVYGFLQAAQAGNYSTAAQYLQMSNARRLTQGEDLASKLKLVMDRAFTGDLRAISNQRDGTPQEGVPLDRQRIGSLSAGDVDDELTLVHVPDAGGARIWLILSDTLAKIPELYEQVQVRQVETRLPGFFVHNEFAGLPVWQWFAILLAIPFAAGLGWVAVQLLKFPRYIWLRRHKQFLIPAWAAISSPLWLVLTAIIHALCMRYVRLPLLQRHYYQMLIGVVLIIGFNWLLWRILQRLARGVRERAIYAGRAGTGSVMLLGERILKALILILAVFFDPEHARLQHDHRARRTGNRWNCGCVCRTENAGESFRRHFTLGGRSHSRRRRLPLRRPDRHGRRHQPSLHSHSHSGTDPAFYSERIARHHEHREPQPPRQNPFQ